MTDLKVLSHYLAGRSLETRHRFTVLYASHFCTFLRPCLHPLQSQREWSV